MRTDKRTITIPGWYPLVAKKETPKEVTEGVIKGQLPSFYRYGFKRFVIGELRITEQKCYVGSFFNSKIVRAVMVVDGPLLPFFIPEGDVNLLKAYKRLDQSVDREETL
jgi:hypothetical protein